MCRKRSQCLCVSSRGGLQKLSFNYRLIHMSWLLLVFGLGMQITNKKTVLADLNKWFSIPT